MESGGLLRFPTLASIVVDIKVVSFAGSMSLRIKRTNVRPITLNVFSAQQNIIVFRGSALPFG
jgi:hypothetical protein